MRDDYSRAHDFVRESLCILQNLGHWRGVTLNLQLLAHLTADSGDAERSTRLFGAVASLQETLGNRHAVTVVQDIASARTGASSRLIRPRCLHRRLTRHGKKARR